MTNDRDKKDTANSRLRQLLAAYGADRSRWPEQDRAQFSDTDAEDAGLSDEIDEARALDKILSRATPALPTAEAASRMAAAIEAQVTPSAESNVVALSGQADPQRNRAPRFGSSLWPDAVLIAASLIIGIALGQSDILSDVSFGFSYGDPSAVDELGSAVFGLNFDPDLISENTL